MLPATTNKANTGDVYRKILSIPRIHFSVFRLRRYPSALDMTKRTWQEIRFWSVVSVLVISAAWLSHHYTSGYARPHVPDLTKIPIALPVWDGRYPCVSADVRNDTIAATLTRCSIPGENGPSTDRFDVDLRYGRFILRQTDFFVDDDIPIVLTRTYNSYERVHRNHDHAFGRNSSHRYDIAPVGSRNPWTFQYIGLEDGEVLFFPRISPGASFDDAGYRQTEQSGPYYCATQQWDGTGWRLTRSDGLVMRFPDSYSATNAAQGAPFEILDGAGHKLKLNRNEVRDLEEIRTQHGHYVRFRYDDQHRITHGETDAGQWRDYKYNSDSMLTDVFGPQGLLRHFEYEGDLMTLVYDGKHNLLLRNTYNDGWLVAEELTGTGTYLYNYGPNSKVKITKPDGTNTTVDYSHSFPPSSRGNPR